MDNRIKEIKTEMVKLKKELYYLLALEVLKTATIKDFNWYNITYYKKTNKGAQTYTYTKFELRKYATAFNRIKLQTSYSKEDINRSVAIQNELIEKYKKHFTKKLKI